MRRRLTERLENGQIDVAPWIPLEIERQRIHPGHQPAHVVVQRGIGEQLAGRAFSAVELGQRRAELRRSSAELGR